MTVVWPARNGVWNWFKGTSDAQLVATMGVLMSRHYPPCS